jgi:hypothetical protein
MNQIKSIRLGVIAICIATVPLSLAQTPRTGTSGSNRTGAITTTTTAAPRNSGLSGNSTSATQIGINAGSAINPGAITNTGAHPAINAGVQTGISNQGIGIIGTATGNGGLSGNSTRATQIGINAGGATNIGATTNIGAHTTTNVGAQTGISNQAIGITGAAAGKGGSSVNSTGATQTGANARTGTNTTANTNAGAHTGSAAATPTIVNIIQPQFTPAPSQGPLPNNDPLGPNFSTPGQSPSPSPSASVSPTPTPPPI